MKSIILRSLGVSLFLLCLTFSSFADGEMTTGSKSGNGDNGGSTPLTTNQTVTENNDSTSENATKTDFLEWIAGIFADIVG